MEDKKKVEVKKEFKFEPVKPVVVAPPVPVVVNTEKEKAKDKLKLVQSQLVAAEKVYTDILGQLTPLQEKANKLKKDLDYYQSRVRKYEGILKGESHG